MCCGRPISNLLIMAIIQWLRCPPGREKVNVSSFTTFVVLYLTVFPLLDEDQSLSYFLHGVPEWQSGHTTRKQDGSAE